MCVVDASLPPATECDCPWDYCDVREKLPGASVLVQFADEKGASLPGESRKVFDVKELSTVVARGKVSRDDKGKFVILASGLFVKEK